MSKQKNKIFNRRNFLKTAGVAAASVGVAPKLAFAEDEFSDNILVFVFQRGGIDGLSFMAPMNGQGNLPGTGWFYENVRDLSASLLAFFTDLDGTLPQW